VRPLLRGDLGIARFAARLALGALLLTSLAAAQGGYVTEKRPELGLVFPRARSYEEIPTPPDETHVVLSFIEKLAEKEKDRKDYRPGLQVIWIEKTPESREGEGTAPEGAQRKRRPINSVSRYFGSAYARWELGVAVEGKTRDGFAGTEHTLTPAGQLKESRVGWIYAYQNDQRAIVFLGVCLEQDLRDQVKIWRYTAERVEISEPEGQSTEKLERMYARSGLPNPEYRIAVRKRLVPGWKAEDTEHYIVIYDTKDQPLVRKIVRDLELLREEYVKLFPASDPVQAVSTVRICKNAEEYVAYGGDPDTAGYWNWDAEELVLYDAESVDRHVKSDADTFVVLYHEAFHQYIHYSSGELPPHSWFNEGHGDYFSGALIKDGKLRSIGPNPWRVDTVKAMVERGRTIPWKEILRYEQPEFYAKDKVGRCYAQGWSMIYFLRKSKLVEKRPEWARILPAYFETLKSAYAEAKSDLERQGKSQDRVARTRAGLEARKRAVETAFSGVDLDEIETAWEEFVRTLETPKRG
jgi:hypothetical protein